MLFLILDSGHGIPAAQGIAATLTTKDAREKHEFDT
jgi:hypothetical protein